MARTSVEKLLLSGSTNGLAILVAATVTPGDLIHTAHATAFDEIVIYAYNHHTATVGLTLEWGGTGTGQLIKRTITFQTGASLEIPGFVLTGSLVVRAFASVASKVSIYGHVLRATTQ